ncbi:hypothetical protein M3Y97_00111900 [Aphelenchoides bicaudatus]|nr:hypothetical protein M3Y97_00111900 [Aphelenchoides bicaudatus]
MTTTTEDICITYQNSLTGPILYYTFLSIQIVIILAFWQLVQSGVVDKDLSRGRFFSTQITVGLFDNTEIAITGVEDSVMEILPSIKIDPKEKISKTEESVIEKKKTLERVTEEQLKQCVLQAKATDTPRKSKTGGKSATSGTSTGSGSTEAFS